MDGLVLLLILLVPLLLWVIISPRSHWRVVAGWAYRNPEANEPSDTAYAVTRIFGIGLLVVLVWQLIAMTTRDDDSDDKAAPPVTTTPAPVTTTRAIAGEELRAAFGVDEATIVMAPEVSIPVSDLMSARKLEVLQYRAFRAELAPAYLSPAFAGQTGDWLILGVRADAPPSGVSRIESGMDTVTVTVLPACGTACPGPLAGPGKTYYLVPVRLDKSLSDRGVKDGLYDLVPSPAAPSRTP